MFRSARWRIVVLIWIVASCSPTSSSSVVSNDNCWTNDAECLVQVTLHKNTVAEDSNIAGESLPLEIDCMKANLMDEQSGTSTAVTRPAEYLLKLFERAFRVTLNGCRKALKWPTFGFEYLPNCDKITEMKVTRFHADASYELHCPSATFMQLETLRFEHNEIATITTEALSNLSLLKELVFKSNALRHVERGAFDSLPFIERLQMETESHLAIKDAMLFEHTKVVSLRLFQLKFVTSALFEKLPQTLRELHVEKTTIGVGAAAASEETASVDSVSVNNRGLLTNISTIECALKSFRLNDDFGSVQYLNLSRNLLREFQLTKNHTVQGALEIKILDLSHNGLAHLPLSWLHVLSRLERLSLNENSLKTLPLMPLLLGLPVIQILDLRNNQLESLTDTIPYNLENEALYRVLIHIDNNPWNCKWLLAFAHTHPELFRIFHYEKFLSQINVNGLACMPEEPKSTTNRPFNISSLLAVESNGSLVPVSGNEAIRDRMNVSTFTLVYGSPYDLKRNQRAEALIIVFMLPLGIAVLFLLLYLWIYCQKVFHLSFYRNCRWCKRRKNFNARRVNHFDVVRQVPPNISNTNTTTTMPNNEDYELPLNGVAPICNCAHSNSNSTINTANLSTHEKCQKTHHITYVPLPDEKPQKIYEEIIGDDGDQINEDTAVIERMQNESHVNTIYDHLSFESTGKES